MPGSTTPGTQPYPGTILFGARSPMVVEYEEVCSRAGIPIMAAIHLGGTPRLLNSRIIVAFSEMEDRFSGLHFVPVAFSPLRRRELTDLASAKGLVLARPVVDPSAVVFSSSRIRDGAFIGAGTVVGALTILGTCCLLNRSASIGHHCVIGDYASIGPGTTLASNVRIGEGCVVGAGSTILPSVEIGAGAVIAAGSVVRKSVKPGMLVSGNPARELRPRASPATSRSDNQDE